MSPQQSQAWLTKKEPSDIHFLSLTMSPWCLCGELTDGNACSSHCFLLSLLSLCCYIQHQFHRAPLWTITEPLNLFGCPWALDNAQQRMVTSLPRTTRCLLLRVWQWPGTSPVLAGVCITGTLWGTPYAPLSVEWQDSPKQKELGRDRQVG